MKKKASMDFRWLIVITIIVIVSLVIIIMFQKELASINIIESSGVRLCTFSNKIKMDTAGNLPGGVKVSRFCKTQTVDIYPDDWGNCDSKFRDDFENGYKEGALKDCTSQQIAEYALKCWEMNGNGVWKTSSWICYNLNIKEPKNVETGIISASNANTKIKQELEEIFECNSDSAKVLEYNFGYKCEDLVDELDDYAYNNLFNNIIIDYYSDKITKNSISTKPTSQDKGFIGLDQCNNTNPYYIGELIEICSSEEEYNENIDRVITAEKVPFCTEAYEAGAEGMPSLKEIKEIIYPWCSEISDKTAAIAANIEEMKAIIAKYISNWNEVESITYSCNVTEDVYEIYACEEDESNTEVFKCVYKYKKDGKNEEKVVTIKKEKINEMLEAKKYTFSVGEDCDVAVITYLSFSLEDVGLVSRVTPDLVAINENNFKNFLADTIILGEEVKYTKVLGRDDVRFLDDTKIRQNTLVSMGFCAGGAGNTGGGISPRLNCNLATGPEIQFGMQRLKSPLPGYCSSREIVPYVGDQLAQFCETRRNLLYN